MLQNCSLGKSWNEPKAWVKVLLHGHTSSWKEIDLYSNYTAVPLFNGRSWKVLNKSSIFLTLLSNYTHIQLDSIVTRFIVTPVTLPVTTRKFAAKFCTISENRKIFVPFQKSSNDVCKKMGVSKYVFLF